MEIIENFITGTYEICTEIQKQEWRNALEAALCARMLHIS